MNHRFCGCSIREYHGFDEPAGFFMSIQGMIHDPVSPTVDFWQWRKHARCTRRAVKSNLAGENKITGRLTGRRLKAVYAG